ncbi:MULTISPECIES: hypothetical protein [unclassified Moorena]|uniref:Uncharacterized protein n=1 Tax=Moorena producens 3L TaxID=489825 RepID=F4XYU5_9CYAN|nr:MULTISPECIES: hypothetical protein [unclassified Moorena]EGJ30236.1 hypothetical protein LYNGBM3L_52910 [Moorena producens 3L]
MLNVSIQLSAFSCQHSAVSIQLSALAFGHATGMALGFSLDFQF